MARKATKSKPRFTQTDKPLRLVMEGGGDVIGKYYAPALKTVKDKLQGNRDVQVTFVDKSEFWRNDLKLAGKIQKIIESVRSLGADYLDKSDPADLTKYQALEADVVIIATPDFSHVEVVEEWLRRQLGPQQIFIEKPLADSLNATRRLLGITQPYDDGILAFDHYRARLLPTRYQMKTLLDFWGKGLQRFTFYFLEDHSGADPCYPDAAEVKRDGPIENEQRVMTIRQGVILDTMPHIIAILAHFCRVETLRVTLVRAGQYIGVDGNPNKPTEIEKETLAEVRFVCADYAGNWVEGLAYVGKGVRGVEALGTEYDYNVKLAEIVGLNGYRVRFDLRSAGKGSSEAHLIDESGKTQLKFGLYPKRYETFLEKIADGTYLEDRLALNVELGKRILEVLEDLKLEVEESRFRN
jgi:predicted dehydrogenase